MKTQEVMVTVVPMDGIHMRFALQYAYSKYIYGIYVRQICCQGKYTKTMRQIRFYLELNKTLSFNKRTCLFVSI